MPKAVELTPFDDEGITPYSAARELCEMASDRGTQRKLLGRIITADLVLYAGNTADAEDVFARQAAEHTRGEVLHFLIRQKHTVVGRDHSLTIGHAEMHKDPLFRRGRFGGYRPIGDLGVGISAWTNVGHDHDMQYEIEAYRKLIGYAAEIGLAGAADTHGMYACVPAVYEGAAAHTYQRLYACLTENSMVWTARGAFDDRQKRKRGDPRPPEQVLFVYNKDAIQVHTPSP